MKPKHPVSITFADGVLSIAAGAQTIKLDRRDLDPDALAAIEAFTVAGVTITSLGQLEPGESVVAVADASCVDEGRLLSVNRGDVVSNPELIRTLLAAGAVFIRNTGAKSSEATALRAALDRESIRKVALIRAAHRVYAGV